MLVFCSDEVHICLERREACCFRWCFLFPFLSRVGSELETKQNISSSNWALFFSSQDLKTDNHLVNNNLCQLTYCSTILRCHKRWKVSSRPKSSSFYLGYDNYSSSYDSLTLTSHVMSNLPFQSLVFLAWLNSSAGSIYSTVSLHRDHRHCLFMQALVYGSCEALVFCSCHMRWHRVWPILFISSRNVWPVGRGWGKGWGLGHPCLGPTNGTTWPPDPKRTEPLHPKQKQKEGWGERDERKNRVRGEWQRGER